MNKKYIFFLLFLYFLCSCAGTQKILKIVSSTKAPFQCKDFQLKLSKDFQSGYVEVPEDWNAPQNKKLRIFFYGKWSGVDLKSSIPPLIIMNGGPGFSSISTFRAMLKYIAKTKQRFIFMDQRGTGCSSGYPPLTSTNIGRYANFSSIEIVKDAEVIRKKVFGDHQKWRVFGHSFGSKIALRYVALFPNSIDRVITMGDSYDNGPANAICQLKLDTKAEYEMLQRFMQNYPQTKDRLQKLFQSISPHYCYSDEAGLIKSCGYDVVKALGHDLEPSQFSQIAETIQSLETSDQQVNYRALDKLMFQQSWNQINPAMVLLWKEDYSIFLNSHTTCGLALDELKREHVGIPEWALTSCSIKRALDSLPEKFKTSNRILHLQEIYSGMKQNVQLKIIEFIGADDILNKTGSSCNKLKEKVWASANILSRWKKVVLQKVSHTSIFEKQELWNALSK